jgi:PKD repeat protein
MHACFTVDKKSTVVGDSITFSDCSYYDGRSVGAAFDFGDGETGATNDSGQIKHAYSSAGIFTVTMQIGGPEVGNSVKDTLVIQ